MVKTVNPVNPVRVTKATIVALADGYGEGFTFGGTVALNKQVK